MSDIFPRLISTLANSTNVRPTSAVQTVEAIKNEVLGKFEALPRGTILHAEVISRLKDGTYIANVAEIPLRLALPSGTKPGEKLNLSLVQLHPSPVFSLENGQLATVVDHLPKVQASTTAPVTVSLPESHSKSNSSASLTPHAAPIGANLYQTLSQGNATEPHHSPQSVRSSELQLSEMAKIIGTVLRDSERSKQKLSIKGSIPLTDDLTAKLNPRGLASRLEIQLQQQIDHSGMSYEAHVAQWANGNRSIDQLKLEPQGKIDLQFEETILTDEKVEQHQQLAEIVHQQLDLVDGLGLHWQGQLSPSIPFQLHIFPPPSEEQKNSSPSQEQNEGHAATTSIIELDFPTLGHIRLEIDFKENHSQVRCQVASAELIQELHDHSKALIDALNARGQKLQSMKVSCP
ncbi:flagellar hook-length control protein FliK [Undibacterium cyanobacteriorum]|uniref:Flagellar hook-length control protein FliK n=1 Tax=Undibacterium cyanobacteriorum TaxID=3073561 RepID=A0ABY9RLY0_9BURK|nr:flagellar hook-length control protein FliK [Undibacterium sp. 20NA77.5]WMW82222.1 flagellar hook-length control protein FliK [Undibacterium sp. 20NA77.5]